MTSRPGRHSAAPTGAGSVAEGELPALSWLERLGVRTIGRGAQSWLPPTNSVSELDAEERKSLRALERGAVARAALAGAASAGITAAVAMRLSHIEEPEPVTYWTWVGLVGVVTSIAEVAYLYWDALASVRRMAKVSGVRLFAEDTLDHAVAVSLARAALELPTPADNPLRVDPHREARRWRLLLISLFYKAKIALSTFVLKVLLRRVFGRLFARAAFEFVAVPVTALWNAAVCRRVLREARVRTMGPSLAKEMSAWILEPLVGLERPADAVRLIAWALGTSIVKNGFVHPNWVVLVRLLQLPASLSGDFGDAKGFLVALEQAKPATRTAVLRALLAAAILDGRVSRLERQWLVETFDRAGLAAPVREAEHACRAFLAGDGFDTASFDSMPERKSVSL